VRTRFPRQSSATCPQVDAQIADWPVCIRGFGLAVDLFSVNPLEGYASTSEMLKATVVGEFFECYRRLSTLLPAPCSCLSRSPWEEKTQAAVLAWIVSGVLINHIDRPPITFFVALIMIYRIYRQAIRAIVVHSEWVSQLTFFFHLRE
jgi:hypothetical protein